VIGGEAARYTGSRNTTTSVVILVIRDATASARDQAGKVNSPRWNATASTAKMPQCARGAKLSLRSPKHAYPTQVTAQLTDRREQVSRHAVLPKTASLMRQQMPTPIRPKEMIM
jgi:hypothetical protein